jgi:hypothetical protein
MLSIIFVYSSDRLDIFQNTICCMEDIPLFDECQKIICADGDSNIHPPGFEVVTAARRDELYCFADALNAGVGAARHETLLYLDGDRVLPRNYLGLCLESVQPGTVLYSESFFRIRRFVPLALLKNIRDDPQAHRDILTQEYRLAVPAADYGKCPFSGNACMLKKDYLAAGGFDPRYVGYGFPDTDFFLAWTRQGFAFRQVPGTELHQYHEPSVPLETYRRMNLWNGLKFCKKWGLAPEGTLKERMLEYRLTWDTGAEDISFADFARMLDQRIGIE